MVGIDHQTVKVEFSYRLLQQRFPNALVTPAAKPTMCVFPVAVVRWEVTPRRARAQNPENRVDKQLVILRRAAQTRLDMSCGRNVDSVICFI